MNQEKFGPIYRMWNGRNPEVFLQTPEDVEVSCSRKVLFFTFIDIRVHYLFLT